MSTGGPEETNSQNEIESEREEFKTLAIINIQLFRQRLSHNSTKAHATMATGIIGIKSLALLS